MPPTPIECPVPFCEWDTRGKQNGSGPNLCLPLEGDHPPRCLVMECIENPEEFR